MVLIEVTVPWVKPEQFERKLIISDVYSVKGKYGNEIELRLQEHDTLAECRMSVYGKNKNFLVNTYGPDTDNWLTKPISITVEQQNGKDVRVLRVPK